MPKTTGAGASSAWEDPVLPAPTALEGEHGPELLDLPVGDVVVPLPEGWTPDPGPAPDADYGSIGGKKLTGSSNVGGELLDDAPPLDYGSLPHAALRDEAKTRGLPAAGSKADLAARLAEHDAAVVGPDLPGSAVPDGGEGGAP